MNVKECGQVMKEHCRVIYHDPMKYPTVYERIERIEYIDAADAYAPIDVANGFCFGAILVDSRSNSRISVAPRYISRYSAAEFERRKQEYEKNRG